MNEAQNPKLQLEQYIAMKVKQKRSEQGLKITDVARIAGLSQGMISKIENAQVSTSLDTLNRLCDAIGLSISQLFSDYDRPTGSAQLVKAGEGMEVVRRGTEKGHTYQLLSYHRGKKKSYEPFLITMDDAAEVFPTFSHPGQEFIYLLQGRIQYRHGNHLYEMEPGDALSFDAEVPHGPELLREVPIQLLSVIHYDED
ncbi:helix-turn-helix domain-containing protein [Marinobacterium rhizophilum]|uniref:helix-turn-helix domain-containing protein n=1 Tax=Marinobacterium rhizophilum TaxID=420402 RepID=UPI000377EE8B|nr:XRE family transcriptional regulator [Marinobacterium rhizophilum]